MNIELKNLSKRFNLQWIFRDINYKFLSNHCYGITGINGSGKSTLLKIISGILPANDGLVTFSNPAFIEPGEIYKYLSIAAPYQSLVEEFTLRELLKFHCSLKFDSYKIDPDDFSKKLLISESIDKPLSQFSSGMKQRVKLGLALYSNSPLLLLDEPCSNLDRQGIDWYLEEMKKIIQKKTILIFSNQIEEYSFSDTIIDLNEWN